MKHVANHLVLTACIAQIDALRYTPAGLPSLNLRLEHESDLEEAGQTRQVKASIKALALGTLAERLAQQAIGSDSIFSGFLMTPRNGKQLVFHIQEFQRLTNS